ncbi:U32 family peptidase [uncultured Methanocorpusculum sp.]|nr:U32 family peptidase [uncultured Methanocorpusculum sp.]
MDIPELLSPAGSPEALKAAVYAGCDAVYLGGKSFGARQYAANFTNEELTSAVIFAHQYGVKVYVTVNTLAYDDDMPGIAGYLRFLSDIGVDAILVQDVGVLSLAREIVPDLPLHASTQMTIHNAAGVRFAAEHGVSRVVLSRELPFDDVKKIAEAAKEVGVELEIFIHGAICYAYSGQCLFSSVIGGRSGNQGACAQPCRKPYTLLADGETLPTQGDYHLSPRDLCMYPYLEEICSLGVAAVKIEGRMKTPEYVGIVTDAYRRGLDTIAAGEEFVPDNETMEDLAFAFNRGFTKGYLFGDKWGTFINAKKPDNRGVYAGFVSGLDESRGKVIVKIEGPVPDTGDGLVFKIAGRETGFALNKEPYIFPEGDAYKIPAPADVVLGSELWITRRMKTERKAAAILSKPFAGRIPLDIVVSVDKAGRLTVSSDGVEVKTEMPMLEALNKPVSKESVETQMRKTGGTPFFIQTLSMQYDGTMFLPMSVITDLRRKFLDATALARKPIRITRPYAEKGTAVPERMTPIIQVYTDSVVGAKAAHSAGAGQVVYEGFEEIYDLPIIYKLPRIVQEHEFASAFSKIPAGAAGVMVDGVGAAESIKGVPKYGGSGLNITNARSAVTYGKSCRQVCLSPELSGKQIRTLMEHLSAYAHPPKTEVIVQGSLEVMVSENCIPATVQGCRSCNQSWALKDKTNRIFRVRTDSQCRGHILNSSETCLIEYVGKLASAGVSVISIDARGGSPEYIRRMTAIYTAVVDGTGDPKELKEQIKDIASGGITAGHYLRGVVRE